MGGGEGDGGVAASFSIPWTLGDEFKVPLVTLCSTGHYTCYIVMGADSAPWPLSPARDDNSGDNTQNQFLAVTFGEAGCGPVPPRRVGCCFWCCCLGGLQNVCPAHLLAVFPIR